MSLPKSSFLLLLIFCPLGLTFAASSDCDSNGDTQFGIDKLTPQINRKPPKANSTQPLPYSKTQRHAGGNIDSFLLIPDADLS